MQHGDFATAESLLQKAITAKPNDYRAWFDLGYVYNATQRSAQAIDAYRKSVAAKPDVFESNLNLGILLAGQGDKVEAAKYLKAATQLKPTANPEEGLARAWQSLGHVEEDSDPQQALAAYAEAAKLNPKAAQPHLSAGILLEKRNDLDARSARVPVGGGTRSEVAGSPCGLGERRDEAKEVSRGRSCVAQAAGEPIPRTTTRAFNWDASWQPRARAPRPPRSCSRD